MKWVKKEIDPQEVREISKKYNINLIIASILARRGITGDEEIRYFIDSNIMNLHNPFLFEEMEEAVDRINTAIEVGERIGIFGDRDVDGITSTVLLYETLQELGAEVQWFLPEGEENYGLTEKSISDLLKNGIKLLITVDCGISNIEEIEIASNEGIDTIVIDHHNPADVLPDAVAIINPKVKGTRYPFKDLSGCGVVSKLTWSLYFSKTPFYGQTICLLNIKPVNESFTLEAVRLNNLVEVDRLVENLVPGILKYENTRLPDFLGGYETIVYGLKSQKNMLSRVFGSIPDLELSDIEPFVKEYIPHLSGKSLIRIKELEPSFFIGSQKKEEIDVLKYIFMLLVFKKEEKTFERFQERLDIVALGTVADLMPLVDENRILVKVGMKQLSRSKRSGLKELFLRKSLLGKELKTLDIAWQISPFINSAGRMGEPGRATELLLASDDNMVSELVDYISELNKKRKGLGSEAWEKVKVQARDSYDRTGGKFVVAYDPEIHRGVTGIIAARLVNTFGVPAIVMTDVKDRIVGSLRSTDLFSIKDFLENFAKLFDTYGGHDFAAGFSMPKVNLDSFLKKFYDLVDYLEIPEMEKNIIKIDAEIPINFLTPKIANTILDFFEPFGEKNPPLVFLTKGITVESLNLVGRKELSHLKLLLASAKYKWPAIFWNGAETAEKIRPGDKINIVYKITKNFYQSMERLQLNIMDIKR